MDCGPTFNGRQDRCYSPPASGNVEHCRLHGAAPRLYEALRALTDPEGHLPHPPGECTGECRDAMAAIAEVEGRSEPGRPLPPPAGPLAEAHSRTRR
jgi:hypothetical protein